MGSAWRALADPTRREILQLLRRGERSAGEIAAHFDVSKPTISHHLKELRQAGLITQRKQGMHVICTLNTSVFEELLAFLASLSADKPHPEKGE